MLGSICFKIPAANSPSTEIRDKIFSLKNVAIPAIGPAIAFCILFATSSNALPN